MNSSPQNSARRKSHDVVESPVHKRLKVAIACDPCRAKKSKCDGVQPVCGPCLKRRNKNAHCTWEHGSTRDIQNASKDHVLRLERRIKELEQNERLALENHNITSLDEIVKAAAHDASKVEDDHRQLQQNAENSLTYQSRKSSSNETGLNKKDDVPAPTSAMIGSIDDENPSKGFFGSSSAGSFISQVRKVVDQKLGPTKGNSLLSGSEATNFQTTQTITSPQGQKVISSLLPSRKQADILMATYWNAVYPLYPYLDKVETIQFYEKLWTSRDSSSTNEDFLCLLNLIFALSSQLDLENTPQQRRKSSQIFFERAQQFMNIWKTGSIQSIQALLILAQYLQSTNEPYQCWVFVGLAIRTAQSLGLHLAETGQQAGSPRKREILTRVWHGCILMDRVIAMTYGRPTMIEQSVATAVPLPNSIDDEYLSSDWTIQPRLPNQPSKIDFFIKSLKLYEIMHEILIGLYTPGREISNQSGENYFGICNQGVSELSILDIDRKLMEWENSIPPHLQRSKWDHVPNIFQNVINDNTIFFRQAVVLRQRFLHVRLLSLRPILSSFTSANINDSDGLLSFGSLLSRRLAHQCSVVCVKIAQEAIDIVHSYRANDVATSTLLAAWWYNILFVYSAATVLIAARLRLSIISELGEDSILRSWNMAMQVLQGYSSFSDSIPRLIATLLVLSNQIPSRYSQHRQDIDFASHQNGMDGFKDQQAESGSSRKQYPSSSDHTHHVHSMDNAEQENLDLGLFNEEVLVGFDDLLFDPNDLSWLNAVPFEF